MAPQHPVGSTRFAGYPTAFVYDAPKGKQKKVQHLLWGDWLRVTGEPSGSYVPVHARGVDGWMKADEIHPDRLLEVAFLDVGQGDGCLVVTPEDKHIVIDAGENDNVYRFLRWRYGGFRKPWAFEAGIITHPDMDHYGGFRDIFQDPFVTFETIYHNGIVERYDPPLGATKRHGQRTYLTDLVRTLPELKALLARKSLWQRTSRGRTTEKAYPDMLDAGLQNGSFRDFRMLSVADGHLPGYGAAQELSIQVLGPVPEPLDGGETGLRSLGSVSKTKNGHSVVLKLRYRNVTLFLGGDLNIPSQELLLEKHTGLDPRPKTPEAHEALVAASRKVFQVDVAKACHHGAADISTRFLDALNPIATVISSGDQEPHAHPRADALGATGLHSRGARPLIFSTELARSTREAINRPETMRARLRQLRVEIPMADSGSRLEKRLIKEFDRIVDSIERSVAVYGSIQLRSDGHRVVIAQKLEQPRGSTKWDIYQLEPQGEGGPLRFRSKYD